ncbi:MAG: ABC transporter substrate-binding protein [Myxococcota bacterium]|nr:ABC transporter substrate-binding protein [Myxococcota bacterium]
MLKMIFLAALFGLIAFGAPWAAESTTPTPVGTESAEESPSATPQWAIDRLNQALLDIMRRADELGYRGRYETVAPVVRETFDTTFMASKSIGPAWRKLGPDERERWVSTFEAYTISNLADRFDGFSGETLEIVGDRPASNATLVVETRLDRPGDDSVGLDYRMREAGEAWKVIDVYSDGKVSEIALRRSEYASVLRSGGIEGLIAAVSGKTEKRAQASP